MTIPAVLAAVALLVAGACSPSAADKGSGVPSATVATEPPRTTTTNPYTMPAVIDVAYVSRVLAGLDAAVGDVVRIILRTRTIPREAYDRLRSLYGTDRKLQFAIDAFQEDMGRNFFGYKVDPGNRVTTVTQLLSVREACVFARISRDYSTVSPDPLTADIQWVALRPLDASRDPNKYNVTSWAYIYEGFPPSRTQPPDPCSA